MRYAEFERQLLELAMRTKDPLTAAFVAYNLRIRMEEAREYLDKMAGDGNISLESDPDGNLYYDFPALPRGTVKPAGPAPVPAPGLTSRHGYNGAASAAPAHHAAHPVPHPMVPLDGPGAFPAAAPRPTPGFSPAVAGLLSFLWPGAGQIYRGEVGAGIGFMIATLVGYVLFIVPGLVMHIISVVNAARAPEPPALTAPPPPYYLPARSADATPAPAPAAPPSQIT